MGVLWESERPRVTLIWSILILLSFLRRIFPSPFSKATASSVFIIDSPFSMIFIHMKEENNLLRSSIVNIETNGIEENPNPETPKVVPLHNPPSHHHRHHHHLRFGYHHHHCHLPHHCHPRHPTTLKWKPIRDHRSIQFELLNLTTEENINLMKNQKINRKGHKLDPENFFEHLRKDKYKNTESKD